MRLPREAYPMLTAVETYLPPLSPAQQRGLVWWVYGAILADNACQGAVVTALEPAVGAAGTEALRQRLREWLDDGADKDAPCRAEVVVGECFAPRPGGTRGWVLAWWQGTALPLALDATALGDRLVVRRPPPGVFQRTTSVFARGLARLRWQLLRVRRLWTRIWLWPEPWPHAPPGLVVVVVPCAESLHD